MSDIETNGKSIEEPDGPSNGQAEEQGEKGKEQFKWLVMVYLAGDNNLTSECVYSLTEIKQVDTGNRVKITAQFDPRGSKVPVHRYDINKNGSVSTKVGAGHPKIADDVTPVVPGSRRYPYAKRDRQGDGAPSDMAPVSVKEVNTGDPKTLFDFISWSMENYEAHHYMVILSGHGGGTEEDFLLKDENPRGSLSIPDLRRVFEAVKHTFNKKIDVLGMDVCLMSMGEVCYEVGGLVDYVVGAEGYSATAGWPYRDILKTVDTSFRNGKAVKPRDLCRIIVNQYTNYYSEYMVGGFSADMAAIDVSTSSMELLSGSLQWLTGELNAQLLKGADQREQGGRSEFLDQIVMAHWEAQSYNGERFADLYDFCNLLEQRCAPGVLSQAASDSEKADNDDRTRLCEALRHVKEIIKAHVVVASCFSGVDYQFSNGIAVYFPWSLVSPYYKNLQFAEKSGWHHFLKTYTEATRRKPRGYMPVVPQHWANVEKFRTGEDRTGEDRGEPHPLYGNPVYSMRNPPLVPATLAGQSPCLGEATVAIESLDRSFFFPKHDESSLMHQAKQ